MERYQFERGQQDLLEGMQVPFAIYQFVNKRVVTLVLSEGFRELFGYQDKGTAYLDMDNDMYKDTHPDDVARIADAAVRFATQDVPYEVVYRSRIKGSSDYRLIHATGRHVHTNTGERLAHVWYTDEGVYTQEPGKEATALSRSLSSALHQESWVKAYQYDYLTGLPRMTYFFELAREEKAAILSAGGQASMLFFDLSGMKFFNASHGFAEGDKLLRAFSRLIASEFSSESCCHVGGDHFAAFAEGAGLEDRLRQLFCACERLNDGKTLPVRVGIYQNDFEDVPPSTAMDRAKFACDQLRESYASSYGFFRSEMLDAARLRQHVVTNFDRALDEGWVQVYYQPIVRAVNGRICDEEALARWIDPQRGFLSPADFIPHLESAGVLYRLDLYVLEQVLEKLVHCERIGCPVVPQSVNLSRSDFDSCDMVEEIRRRVDAAGVSRNLITIEITESVIGSDFEYMEEQIARFHSLGFPVWMDDFGSGYSSLDILQEIPFDLIKFDMNFMRRLDRGDKGKIVLSELMRMASALSMDTVCEGVETAEQVRFLREIGCSKLQGYYFQKPGPLSLIMERFAHGFKIGYENPEEADYYESVGRVSLYDLSFVASEDEGLFRNIFDTIPMGIIEVGENGIAFVRGNQAYRDFMARFFGVELADYSRAFHPRLFGRGSSFIRMAQDCCQEGRREFFDEEMPGGTRIHTFARKIGTNPVTGTSAAAIAVLSVIEPGDDGNAGAAMPPGEGGCLV